MLVNIILCSIRYPFYRKTLSLKKTTRLLTKIHASISLINKEFDKMTQEFDKRFSNLINIYENLYIDILFSLNQNIFSYTPITQMLKKHMFDSILHNLFFQHLISFYDEFSSSINYKISENEFLSYKKRDEMEYNIYNWEESFHRKKTFNILDIEKSEYLNLQYFVNRLEKMCFEKFGFDIQYTRTTLYGNIEMLEFYETMLMWRMFNIEKGILFKKYKLYYNLNEEIYYRRQCYTKKLIYYKNMFLLDIIKEYNQSSKRNKDVRFIMLKKMLKKYGSFFKIPESSISNKRQSSLSETDRIYGKTEIYNQYFSYIDYSQSGIYFEERYSSGIKRYVSLFKAYNNFVLRDNNI
ncbi:hypothetical protein CDIK_2921 [Cucumispora dikerogammari]|nr:hypothetical protein CDIK_2921 [Cucumispora dikerogammari]